MILLVILALLLMGVCFRLVCIIARDSRTLSDISKVVEGESDAEALQRIRRIAAERFAWQ